MSWSQRIFVMMTPSSKSQPEPIASSVVDYPNSSSNHPVWVASPESEQAELGRRFSSLVAPESIGLNGEFDPQGLVKRVAQICDRHPTIRHIQTLCLLQQGGQISLLGKVTTLAQLQQVVTVVQQVEGVQDVDVSQVVIENHLPVEVNTRRISQVA
ncbi:MAG: hypothetical protein MUF72_16520 [Elainella sp. Prado103]|jgi:hypothetical protein|nr:hypothetical protein [Elainella sp. Prado103]